MFKKITTLFQSLTAKESEKPDPERLCYLAATALMIELSRADNSIDQQEIQTIIAIATDTFGLSDDEAADVEPDKGANWVADNALPDWRTNGEPDDGFTDGESDY